jgi:hypothetical protein
MFGWNDGPSEAQTAEIATAKRVIADVFHRSAKKKG